VEGGGVVMAEGVGGGRWWRELESFESERKHQASCGERERERERERGTCSIESYQIIVAVKRYKTSATRWLPARVRTSTRQTGQSKVSSSADDDRRMGIGLKSCFRAQEDEHLSSGIQPARFLASPPSTCARGT
jgi:hypothetical protein